jgi:phenylacetate-CoA ligase
MISFGRLMYTAAQALRRSRSLELLGQIRDAPHASPEAAQAEQMRLLRDLLAHAQRNVPFYREQFAALGMDAADVRTLDDFARLPVLTKAILRERGEELVREDARLETLSPHHSGGSTGVPLTFWRDRAAMEWSDAGTLRNMERAGWRPGDMVAFFWGWNDRLARMPSWEFELRQRMRRMYQLDPFQSGPEEMDMWVRKWRSIRPRFALGYASTLARFAQHVEATGARVAPVSGVFTTAETLHPGQRADIERVFGARAFDLYGSSEVQNIASECAEGGMHVNSDFAVVEAGAPDLPGGPRPLIVTSLRSYAMPFIRYRNEDCGELDGGACPCGSGFPLMKLRIARVSDSFVLPGGRVVHGEYFTHLMYGTRGIDTFQFHQTAPDEITLRIVPRRGLERERAEAVRGAVERVLALAPGKLRVKVDEVDTIPLSAAGKHRFTRSDVAASVAVR